MKVTPLSSAWLCLIFILSCKPDQHSDHSVTVNDKPELLHFALLHHQETGIDFNNQLDIDKLKSPMEYINVYNGGGVAIGDINKDGLPDIYLTGNLVGNKLYLNKGNFKFEDITAKAGVACTGSWSTGATMYDVNEDGLLDIYVCRAYYAKPEQRTNLLFINHGDMTFTEEGAKYGINDPGYSIVATFFDYDKDGHADLFVGNHPLNRNQSYGYHMEQWNHPKRETSNALYHNNGNGTFTDVTEKSGILTYGWTLGVVAADLNQDNWTDLYVAVDHTEPDRYYINNGNGTFTESSQARLGHMSHSSMGIDAADIDNNGLLDLAVVEMLGNSNYNEKTKMASMDPNLFWEFVKNNYHYQYMRNMLQLNMGEGYFSEIGQMAGMH
ncbi:MAG TPA: VCBS repeat-containing protein, partial [Saprospiraceae bacterium]|nr:VCBS repeat-containing protein [Saprospiraceae bacterium]